LADYSPVMKPDVELVGTGPVPVLPYHDPKYYDLEREAIFRRVWLHVGRAAEVLEKGQFIVREIEIAKVSILIVRGSDGEVRAFYNVCAHRSTQLVDAKAGKSNNFSCRYHMWTYDTQGKLRGVPDAENFFDLDKAKCSLREIKLEICAGLLFVNLDPSPQQSLREYLGVWWDRLEALNIGASSVFSEYVYEVDGNWKTAFDNFQEIYHGRFVHADSIGAATMTKENPFGYPTSYTFGPEDLHRSKTLWFNPEFKPGPVEMHAETVMRKFMAEQAQSPQRFATTEHFYIFPNLTLLSVGSQCFTQTIWPLSPGHSRSVVRLYWEGRDDSASLRFAREYRMCRTLDIHSEDRDIIEASQKGIESGAYDEMHFQVHEVTLRHSFNAVDRYVEAYRNRAHALEAVQ
jgi:phenylpropionate dioxygenase-like ring-hydroxylating dioxygenase large terminal subunit